MKSVNRYYRRSKMEVGFFYEWDWIRSEKNYKTAIKLKPNYASAHHWYAWFLMAKARFEEALVAIKQAQTIDPGSMTLNTVLGLPFYYERQYEQAIAQFSATLEMEPGFAQARYYLGSALTQLGLYDDAAAEFEKVAPREYAQQASALLAYTYAMSGQKGKATKILKDLQRSAKTRYVSPYLVAIIYTGLGQKERALAQLARAFQERAAWMVFLKVDPFLDQLHNEPQFSDLLQRIGLLA